MFVYKIINEDGSNNARFESGDVKAVKREQHRRHIRGEKCYIKRDPAYSESKHIQTIKNKPRGLECLAKVSYE